MLTIEYLSIPVGHGRPILLTHIDSGAYSRKAAAQAARRMMELVRRQYTNPAPTEFQIVDQEGEIVYRSWE